MLMKNLSLAVCLFLFQNIIFGQEYYFPPVLGNQWETVSPAELDWCESELDSLYQFLEAKHTKAFIILKNGKIAVEQYFGNFTQDSIWYWASAGKSLTAFLVGIAQQETLININNPTSEYLGTGWTSATSEQELAITIWHQITMTTGLDEDVPNQNCLDSECLNYLTDPGERWYYYNAPYRLVQDAIASASGQTFNQYTFSKLGLTTGINGLWVDHIFFSKPRHAARFGLLVLNNGIWEDESILSDQIYFQNMINTSQTLNPSYGYLWWLNGKGAYRLPQSELLFNTDLIPNAPADAIAALGKNDQKIYIVPSQDLVVVRMGDASGDGLLALSSFDNQLWAQLNNLFCNTNQTTDFSQQTAITIYPNPVRHQMTIKGEIELNSQVFIYNSEGQLMADFPYSTEPFASDFLVNGVYFLEIKNSAGKILATAKFVKL